MNAVIYARTSKDDPSDQTKLSSAQQIAQCLSIAEANNYSVVATIEDRDRSGALWPNVAEAAYDAQTTARHGIHRRDGFTRVIELIRSGEAKVLILWNTTRLARPVSPFFSGWLTSLFQSAGVVIHTVEKGRIDLSELAHELLMTIEQTILRREIDANSRKSQSAKKALFSQGYLMGAPCLGYESAGRQMVRVNPDEAETVKRIFHLWTEKQYGLYKIEGILEREGRRTKYGKRWFQVRVRAILWNPHYIGKYYDSDGNLKDSPVYPPIIDPDVWFAAQQVSRKMVKVPTKTRNQPDRLTGGLVVCGTCGSNLRISNSTNTLATGEYQTVKYYACLSHRCSLHGRIRQLELDGFVRYLIDHRDRYLELVRRLKTNSDQYQAWHDSLNAKETQLAELKAKRDTYINEMASILTPHDLAAVLARLKGDIDHLETDITDITQRLSSLEPSPTDWKLYAYWLFERIEVHAASHVDLYLFPNAVLRVPIRLIPMHRFTIFPLTPDSQARLEQLPEQVGIWALRRNLHLAGGGGAEMWEV